MSVPFAAYTAPRRRWSRRHPVLSAVGAFFVVCGIAGVAAGANHSATIVNSTSTGGTSSVASTKADPNAATNALNACMADGSIHQITMTTGSIFNTVDIYMTYGNSAEPIEQQLADNGKGQLVVAAFDRCKTSAEGTDGLVSVYGADGSILANGNY